MSLIINCKLLLIYLFCCPEILSVYHWNSQINKILLLLLLLFPLAAAFCHNFSNLISFDPLRAFILPEHKKKLCLLAPHLSRFSTDWVLNSYLTQHLFLRSGIIFSRLYLLFHYVLYFIYYCLNIFTFRKISVIIASIYDVIIGMCERVLCLIVF